MAPVLRVAALALAAGLLLATTMPAGAAQSRDAQLARAGWKAIADGEPERAADAFRAALVLNPQEPLLHFGAGVAAHLLGRYDEARDALQRTLRLRPDLTDAAVLLGEAAYRLGDLDLAIRTYEEALGTAPGHARMQQKLAEWQKEAALHREFQERPGVRFRVLFEGPAQQQFADRVAAVLEDAYWKVGQALNEYPRETITIVLYTREQFRDVTKSPAWAGGAFDGRIRIPVRGAEQRLAELDRVVTHEFVHAVVRSRAPSGVPKWLDEGLAVFFEGSDEGWIQERIGKAGALLPLQRLERTFRHLDAGDAALAYAQSAIAARVLYEWLGPALSVLLEELGRGRSFAEALLPFGMTVEYFEEEWRRRAAELR